jgi:hypothetical protein
MQMFSAQFFKEGLTHVSVIFWLAQAEVNILFDLSLETGLTSVSVF